MTYGFLKGGLTTHEFLGLWNETMGLANPCTDSRFSAFCSGSTLNTISATSNSMATASQNAVAAVCTNPAVSGRVADMTAAIGDVGADLLVVQGINVSSTCHRHQRDHVRRMSGSPAMPRHS